MFFKDDISDKRKYHNLYGYSIKTSMRQIYCIDDEQYSFEDWKQKVKYILRNEKFKILLNEQEEIYSRKEEVC